MGENTDCTRPADIEDHRTHKTLLSYKGYTNIYFCPECGKRFNTELKEDKTY